MKRYPFSRGVVFSLAMLVFEMGSNARLADEPKATDGTAAQIKELQKQLADFR